MVILNISVFSTNSVFKQKKGFCYVRLSVLTRGLFFSELISQISKGRKSS